MTTLPRGNDETRPAWGNEQTFTTPYPPFDLNDPTVRTLDLNGDKLIDFILIFIGFGVMFGASATGWFGLRAANNA